VAKQKASLPASYGGIMRYNESIGKLQIEPGYVVIIVAAASILLVLLNVLS
jgi:preprotein translocase subunit Sec61beta